MNKILTVLGALGIGAAAMYLLDPNKGKRRRALIRDKAVGLKDDVKQTIDKQSKDLSNRAQGFLHEAKSKISATKGKLSEQTGKTI